MEQHKCGALLLLLLLPLHAGGVGGGERLEAIVCRTHERGLHHAQPRDLQGGALHAPHHLARGGLLNLRRKLWREEIRKGGLLGVGGGGLQGARRGGVRGQGFWGQGEVPRG